MNRFGGVRFSGPWNVLGKARGSGLFSALLVLLVLAAGAGAVYMGRQAQQLAAVADREKAEKETLATSAKQLESQQSNLSRQNSELLQKTQSLAQDRDNLVAQVTQLRTQLDEYRQQSGHQELVQEERDMLEQLLQKTAEENRMLRVELPLLQSRVGEIEQAYQKSTQERERLVAELANSKDRAREEKLRLDLRAQQQEEDELKKLLKAMHKEVEEVEKRESRARVQLQQLQKDYANAIDENGRLKQHVETIPGKVTQMAKQHQQLLKETADVHYNLGVYLTQSKDYARAVNEFDKVIELRPDDADTHYNLGMIYAESLPDRERALRHFRRYLELNPRATDASHVQEYIAKWQAWEAKERLH